MKSIKSFIKQNKFKVIGGAACLLFGGVSTQQSVSGVISTLLYLVGLALAINLVLEYKEYKKDESA